MHGATIKIGSRFTQSSVCFYNSMYTIMREDMFRPVGV